MEFSLPRSTSASELGTHLNIAGLGVLSWSQMVPMIVSWGMLVLLLGSALLTQFQDTGVTFLVWVASVTDYIPGFHEWFGRQVNAEEIVNDDGGVTVNGEQLSALMLNVWGILSVLLWATSALWHLVRGTKPCDSHPLRRKIGLMTIALTVLLALLGLVLLEVGDDLGYMLAVIFAWLWLASAYSLTASHIIRLIQRSMACSQESNP